MKGIRVKFIWIRGGLVILFVLMQVYLLALKKYDTLDIDVTPNNAPSINIWGDTQLGQTFLAKSHGLARIDVMLGTHGRNNTKDIIFELWELDSNKKQVTQQVFNAARINNNLYHPITFPLLLDSKGKQYLMTFKSPDSTFDNSICLWTHSQDIYTEGDYFVNQEKVSADVIFRVYARRPLISELGRIVSNYQGIFASQTFLVAAFIFFELVQILVLWILLGYIHKTWKTS